MSFRLRVAHDRALWRSARAVWILFIDIRFFCCRAILQAMCRLRQTGPPLAATQLKRNVYEKRPRKDDVERSAPYPRTSPMVERAWAIHPSNLKPQDNTEIYCSQASHALYAPAERPKRSKSGMLENNSQTLINLPWAQTSRTPNHHKMMNW